MLSLDKDVFECQSFTLNGEQVKQVVFALLDQLIVDLTEVHLEAIVHEWSYNLILVASLGNSCGVQGNLSEGSQFAHHGGLFEQITKLGLYRPAS